MNKLTRQVLRYFSKKQTEQAPHSEAITTQPFENYTLVKSANYQFLTKEKISPQYQLYEQQISTPAIFMKKKGIHILPQNLPLKNRKEKYSAILRKLQNSYHNSYESCKTPAQIFHLYRKKKNQIYLHMGLIGSLVGKYKHLPLFRSYNDQIREKTLEQYKKKGVNVKSLQLTIFPSDNGEVWMPTNQRYLKKYIQIISKYDRSMFQQVLDIGSGSGILSFAIKQQLSKSKVYGLDNNPSAVETYNVNAIRLGYKGIRSYECDILKNKEHELVIKSNNLPLKYSLIVANPPWIVARKLKNQSQLGEGVYDSEGLLMKASLKMTKNLLKDKQSRAIFIYSDISKILGLEKESFEEICKSLSLTIHQVHEQALSTQIDGKNPLSQYKSQARILTYELGIA